MSVQLDLRLFDDVYDDDGTISNFFEVDSYGIDFDVDGIVKRILNGQILTPDFQRGYVWDIKKASRFIESILMGLPIPGIFLHSRDDKKLEIIDGLQRCTTLLYFKNGTFDPDGENIPFALHGVSKNLSGLTYDTLSDERKYTFDDTPIRATIVRQATPDIDKENCLLYLFERLNTGGENLTPQEVRFAIYPGKLRSIIQEINSSETWRKLVPTLSNDKRQRGAEIILRCLAFSDSSSMNDMSLTEFLNDYMKKNKDAESLTVMRKCGYFKQAIEALVNLGITDRSLRKVTLLETLIVSLMKIAEEGNDLSTYPIGDGLISIAANNVYKTSVLSGAYQGNKAYKRFDLMYNKLTPASN